jgi:16S rRNA processing protein RimM
VGLLEIGRVGKAHGLAGEVAVDLVTNRPGRLTPGATLVAVAPGRDDEVELVVSRSKPHLGRYLVVFDGVTDRTGAERLRNAVLYAEPEDATDDDELYVHELIGSVVVDGGGVNRGTVSAVEANPASDLLVLEDGSLVPMRFVTSFDGGVVTIEVPEGLFE